MGCLILSITRSYMMHPLLLWIVYSMEKSNTLSISWRVLKSNIWSIWFNSCVRSTTSLWFWGSEIEDEYSDLLVSPYSRRLSFTGLISLDLYLYMSKLYLYFLRLSLEYFFPDMTSSPILLYWLESLNLSHYHQANYSH